MRIYKYFKLVKHVFIEPLLFCEIIEGDCLSLILLLRSRSDWPQILFGNTSIERSIPHIIEQKITYLYNDIQG